MIRVLVVDDHELLRTGVKKLLNDVNDIDVVGEAANGEGAISKARELEPDVVLMDVKMPGIGGLEATRRIIGYNPKVHIVVVTSCKTDPFPSRLLQAGAQGYITKGGGLEEMLKAIRKAHNNERYISPEIAQQLALKSLSDDDEEPFEKLSERELQVMLMITSGQKVQEISDKLCLSPKTVNSYRYRLFEKLKISNDVELTHVAIRHGMLGRDLFNRADDFE